MSETPSRPAELRRQLAVLLAVADKPEARLPLRAAAPGLRATLERLDRASERLAHAVANPPPTSGPVYEHSQATRRLGAWLAKWRPVALLAAPSARERLDLEGKLPRNGRELCALATELFNLIGAHRDTTSFRSEARSELGQTLESARREAERYEVAFGLESLARQALGETAADAGRVLAHGIEIARQALGAQAPELGELGG